LIRGDAFANLGGNGVVRGGAQILDVYVEGAQVGDERVLEGTAEGVRSGYDFVGRVTEVGAAMVLE
jgi:hypothetical protein